LSQKSIACALVGLQATEATDAGFFYFPLPPF